MPFVRVDIAEKRYKRATDNSNNNSKNNKIKNGWKSSTIVGKSRAVNFSGWLSVELLLLLLLLPLLSFFSLMGFFKNEFTGLNGENLTRKYVCFDLMNTSSMLLFFCYFA